MTRRQWLLQGTRSFANLDAPRRTAELLLGHVLGLEQLDLIRQPDLQISPEQEQLLADLAQRCLAREPLAYVLGWKEFYGLRFQVNASTLIPRPESEHLLDEALHLLPQTELRFLDLGTGSGCLAVALAVHRPLWRGLALDLSASALDVARKNAAAHHVDQRLDFLLGDFTRPSDWLVQCAQIDLLISNPPYVSQAEYAELEPGVRDFEPYSALVPPGDVHSHLQAIAGLARQILRPGGLLLLEHGFAQGAACRALCDPADWTDVRTGKDLAGHDRYLAAVRRKLPLIS